MSLDLIIKEYIACLLEVRNSTYQEMMELTDEEVYAMAAHVQAMKKWEQIVKLIRHRFLRSVGNGNGIGEENETKDII